MGAWTQTYRRGMQSKPGTPAGYAVLALKKELDYNGYGEGLVFGTTFGVTMHERTVDFQQAQGISADGEIGPRTARRLFSKRFGVLETNFGVPDQLVAKGCILESAVDPGAVGVADQHDHGIMQINATAHPEITLGEAFDAAFALTYYAKALHTSYAKLGDWDCAIASWNVGGGGASDWCAMHKPSTGGPNWFPDLFLRATAYVRLVRAQVV